MKILKRTLSAFLAVLMCIPSGILTTVNATEPSPGSDYTVMLADGENGILQFSEECMESSTASQEGYNMIRVDEDGSMNQLENDGSVWAFKEGDKVEIEAIPSEGCHVESFSVSPSLSPFFLKKIRPFAFAGATSQPGELKGKRGVCRACFWVKCHEGIESSYSSSFPLGIFKNLTKIPVV